MELMVDFLFVFFMFCIFKMGEVRPCSGGGRMKALEDLFWLCEVVKLGSRATMRG